MLSAEQIAVIERNVRETPWPAPSPAGSVDAAVFLALRTDALALLADHQELRAEVERVRRLSTQALRLLDWAIEQLEDAPQAARPPQWSVLHPVEEPPAGA